MREGKEVPHVDTTEETKAYRKAHNIEEMSWNFYLEKAECSSSCCSRATGSVTGILQVKSEQT